MIAYGYNEHGHFTGYAFIVNEGVLPQGFTSKEPPECPGRYFPVFDAEEGTWGIECYALVAMADPDWLIELYFWDELLDMEKDGLEHLGADQSNHANVMGSDGYTSD